MTASYKPEKCNYLPLDGGFAVGAEGDDGDGDAEVVLDELHVVLELFRKLTLEAHPGEVLLPAGELGVNRLDLGGDVKRNLLSLSAIHLVRGTDFNRVEIVQAVGLHHDEIRHAVDHGGVFQRHKVQPAATAGTSCDSPELMTDTAKSLASLIKQLGRKRTATDTGAVGLEYSENLPYPRRSQSKSGADSADGGGR